MLRRQVESQLENWRAYERRKPLIIRGARQVGKTFSVELLGNQGFQGNWVKIDFEKQPSASKIFLADFDVRRIRAELELLTGKLITPGKTLLFLDEIQVCPEAIKSLRYFYEDMPELHVIAAGSLLEFVLGEFSFPVGRVQFMYMYPLSFYEFLHAVGRTDLAEMIKVPPTTLPEIAHELLRKYLYEYFIIGGMPEAVVTYVKTSSFYECQQVQHELIHSFRVDFAKYAPRADKICLEEVFVNVAKNVGSQIKYAHLAQDYANPTIKRAFYLLENAQIIVKVPSVNPPLLPLDASASNKIFKAILLDIGLIQNLCGLPMQNLHQHKKLLGIYRGALAEQFVGQELRHGQAEGRLHYWTRSEKNAMAEVDYVLEANYKVIPIEVKSGAAGSLRSLHYFLGRYPESPYAYVLHDGPYQELKSQQLVFLPLYYTFFLAQQQT